MTTVNFEERLEVTAHGLQLRVSATQAASRFPSTSTVEKIMTWEELRSIPQPGKFYDQLRRHAYRQVTEAVLMGDTK